MRRVQLHAKAGSMPLLALSAKARLMVPVGAIDSRCELRMPQARMRVFIGSDRRDAKVPHPRYVPASKSGNAPRSRASAHEAA